MNQIRESSANCVAQEQAPWRRLYSILLAALTIGLTSYLVAPMLPIYCVESIENGGLGWSHMEACSFYGTYLAIAHIAPFIGGVLADFLIGRFFSVLIGYCLSIYGFYLLWFFPESMLVPGVLSLALGTGCVKVSLATAVGKICSGAWATYRTKAYEYHYFTSCVGFIFGNFFSNLFFNLYGMKILFLLGSGMVIISVFSYLLSRPRLLQVVEEGHGITKSTPPISSLSSGILAGLMVMSVLFFLCGSQLNSSLSLFIHQKIDRSFFNLTIPTLWFSVFGFIVMTVTMSLRTRLWKSFEERNSFIEPVKMAVGFLFLAASFVLFSLCASFFTTWGSGLSLLIILVAMGLLFMSDVHVRPVLFSSATKFSHPKYHTIATAIVYSTVGIGGKIAGWAAGTAETIGFQWLFAGCALIGFICFAGCLLLSYRLPRSDKSQPD